MKVRDILGGKPDAVIASIGPEQTVAEAIACLCSHRIGALMVLDQHGNPLGIVSERDILWAACQDIKQFGQRSVSELMSKDLICGLLEDDVQYVMQVMTHNRIRHLPVVDNNKLVAILSIGDVIKAQLDSTRVENHKLQNYLQLRGDL